MRTKSILKSDLKIKKNRENIISFLALIEENFQVIYIIWVMSIRNDLFKYFEIENFGPFFMMKI